MPSRLTPPTTGFSNAPCRRLKGTAYGGKQLLGLGTFAESETVAVGEFLQNGPSWRR
jgi:hypothetical protein